MRSIRATVYAVLTFAATGLGSPAHAAVGDHLWSEGFSKFGVVGVDGTDHILAFGTFVGTVDFGGGPITAVNSNIGDLFLVRFDSNGAFLWQRHITPGGGNGVFNHAVAGDAAGNVYVAGWLNGGTVDMGGGAIAGTQGYVTKLDSAGNHVWTKGLGGAHVWSSSFGDASNQAFLAVKIDNTGNVVVLGSVQGTIDFGGGPLTAPALDYSLAAFTSAGAHSWSHVFGGGLTSGGLVHFTSAGAHDWSAVHGSAAGFERGYGVAIDSAGDVLTSGRMTAATDFGGGALPVTSGSGLFAALYDDAGAHLWSHSFGPTTTCFAHFDSHDDMLFDGQGGAGLDFGGGPITPNSLFLAKLDGIVAGATAVLPNASAAVVTTELAAEPNPFSPETSIRFALPEGGRASLAVYDVRGREVQTILPDAWRDAGTHTATWHATGAAGVYFVRLRTAGGERTLKVVKRQ